MKKILLIKRVSTTKTKFSIPRRLYQKGVARVAISIITMAAPAFASCPVTGVACIQNSALYSPSLQERLIPGYLQQLGSPAYYQYGIQPAPGTKQIGTQSGAMPTGGAASTGGGAYNAGCQFGLCLPKP